MPVKKTNPAFGPRRLKKRRTKMEELKEIKKLKRPVILDRHFKETLMPDEKKGKFNPVIMDAGNLPKDDEGNRVI